MAQPAKIIVGLGNPGADYSFNRHNIGFMAVESLAGSSGAATAWQRKHKALTCVGVLAGVPLLFLKPQTFMNLSGEAVGEALRYYKRPPEDVIVIHDDIDLPAGRVKVKLGGGHGGHNGLKSIDNHIGKDYWRLRLGVGHPGRPEEVTGHVLGDFSKADKVWLSPLLEALPKALPHLFDGNQSRFIQALPAAPEA